MTTKPDYFDVFGHMDEGLREDQLTFEQRLNKRCDELAKTAVDVWIARRTARVPGRVKQLLPFESVAVLNSGRKSREILQKQLDLQRGWRRPETS